MENLIIVLIVNCVHTCTCVTHSVHERVHSQCQTEQQQKVKKNELLCLFWAHCKLIIDENHVFRLKLRYL